jgi:hypothetical protein
MAINAAAGQSNAKELETKKRTGKQFFIFTDEQNSTEMLYCSWVQFL